MVKQINTRLTENQKRILFKSETEAPFSGKFYLSKEKGAYLCANCGNKLFKSEAKFDSGSGWPSFFKPYKKLSVITRNDESHSITRTEVICGKCKAHLGHLFDDAPQTPTGKRYCINSLSLGFKKN